MPQASSPKVLRATGRPGLELRPAPFVDLAATDDHLDEPKPAVSRVEQQNVRKRHGRIQRKSNLLELASILGGDGIAG